MFSGSTYASVVVVWMVVVVGNVVDVVVTIGVTVVRSGVVVSRDVIELVGTWWTMKKNRVHIHEHTHIGWIIQNAYCGNQPQIGKCKNAFTYRCGCLLCGRRWNRDFWCLIVIIVFVIIFIFVVANFSRFKWILGGICCWRWWWYSNNIALKYLQLVKQILIFISYRSKNYHLMQNYLHKFIFCVQNS